MKKIIIILTAIIGAIITVIGCSSKSNPASPSGGGIPTMPPFPTFTVTLFLSQTVTEIITDTVTPTLTATDTITETATQTDTEEPVPTPTVTRTVFVGASDIYEPDNSAIEAGIISLNSTRQGAIFPLNDEDWSYMFITEPSGITISVTSDYMPFESNPQPVLYTDSQNIIFGASESYGDADIIKNSSYYELSPGMYYLRIYPGTITAAYTLEIKSVSLNFTPSPTLSITATSTVTLTEPPATTTVTETATETLTDTHTVTVTATATATVTEMITPDPYEALNDDICSNMQEILTNECQDRTLFRTDVDWVYFNIGKTGRIVLSTTGDAGGDTFITLMSSAACAGTLATDDDSNGFGYSKIDTVLEPGLYAFKVESKDVLGGDIYRYRLCLTHDSFTPTVTMTSTHTFTVSPTVTETATFENTGTNTPTITVTATVTITMTATNTPLPGTGWTNATDSAVFGNLTYHTASDFGGYMYVMGSNGSNQVFRSSDGISWQTVSQIRPMSEKIMHTTLVNEGKLWVIGGSGTGSQSRDVYSSIDGADWTYVTGNAQFGLRTSHSSAVFDGKMWVIAGEGPGITYLKSVYSSIDGITWTQASVPPFSVRKNHSTVVYDNKMWVIGGVDPLGSTSSVYYSDVWYTSDGNNWTQATASAAFGARAYHTSMVYDNKIWVIGGGDDNHSLGGAWYSTDGITWTQASSHQATQREYAAGCVFNSRMWLIAGQNQADFEYDDVWWSY